MVDLISTGALPCSASSSGCANGQVKLSLSYASQEGKLIVVVHACRWVQLLLTADQLHAGAEQQLLGSII